MAALVFVDANVVVYALDSGDALKRVRAAEWLDRLWDEQRLRTSMQVLSESYWTLVRKYRVAPDAAWDGISALFSWSPRPIDQEVLEGAHEIEQRYRISWWDSLIVSAAQVQRCEVLLTEDLQDGQSFGGLKVVNPFLHAVQEPAADYLVAGAPVIHRPRGRPRRAYA